MLSWQSILSVASRNGQVQGLMRILEGVRELVPWPFAQFVQDTNPEKASDNMRQWVGPS